MVRFIKSGAVLCMGLLSVAVYSCKSQGAANTTGWETGKVAREDLSDSFIATGTVEPIIQVEVGTQVSGIINHIYVDYNSIVKKGQILAELDKTLLESELESKSADLQISKTEYEYQQKNFNRSKVLYEQQLISDTDYETALYQYEKAKSTYEKNQADLVKARTNLNYATIYSPVDGVVLSRAVDEGQTVAASFNTPTLFTIANDLSKMQVVADVDEADIGGVENGQRVTFVVDAFPNDIFEGEVTQVRLEPTTTSNVVTYEVIINAPNPELKLKPGLTANVTIYTVEKDSVLSIPAKALRFVPKDENAGQMAAVQKEASEKIVWVKDAGGIAPRAVKTGVANGTMVEILSGLNEGEEVVVAEKTALPAVAASQEGGGSSPFMPTPPGKNKK